LFQLKVGVFRLKARELMEPSGGADDDQGDEDDDGDTPQGPARG
jgi:hypothetical protein